MTNKTCCAKKLLNFDNGRGSQEGIYAEIKSYAALDYLPFKKRIPNNIFSLCGVMAHNLTKELQMKTFERSRGCTEKRASLWPFDSLGKVSNELIKKAGRLARPQGELTLTLNQNPNVKQRYLEYLAAA